MPFHWRMMHSYVAMSDSFVQINGVIWLWLQDYFSRVN